MFVEKFINFPKGLNYICELIGIDYYHDFEEDIPESFKLLDMLENMDEHSSELDDKPLKPISEQILTYYCKNYVNDLFYDDNISYQTQKDFEIGFDPESNRYTIPIRSELGDLVGVKRKILSIVMFQMMKINIYIWNVVQSQKYYMV